MGLVWDTNMVDMTSSVKALLDLTFAVCDGKSLW